MARLSDVPPELLDEMTPAVRALVDALLLRLKELESHVADLEAKLAKNSRNSSKSPSSEHPHAKPSPQKKPQSKRKPGGQRGHQKFERTLIPTADCEEIVPCKPRECRGCGKTLRGRDKRPFRQQVWDVEIRPVVTDIPTASFEMPKLRHHDVRNVSRFGRWPHRTSAGIDSGAADVVVSHQPTQSRAVRQ